MIWRVRITYIEEKIIGIQCSFITRELMFQEGTNELLEGDLSIPTYIVLFTCKQRRTFSSEHFRGFGLEKNPPINNYQKVSELIHKIKSLKSCYNGINLYFTNKCMAIRIIKKIPLLIAKYHGLNYMVSKDGNVELLKLIQIIRDYHE